MEQVTRVKPGAGGRRSLRPHTCSPWACVQEAMCQPPSCRNPRWRLSHNPLRRLPAVAGGGYPTATPYTVGTGQCGLRERPSTQGSRTVYECAVPCRAHVLHFPFPGANWQQGKVTGVEFHWTADNPGHYGRDGAAVSQGRTVPHGAGGWPGSSDACIPHGSTGLGPSSAPGPSPAKQTLGRQEMV